MVSNGSLVYAIQLTLIRYIWVTTTWARNTTAWSKFLNPQGGTE